MVTSGRVKKVAKLAARPEPPTRLAAGSSRWVGFYYTVNQEGLQA